MADFFYYQQWNDIQTLEININKNSLRQYLAKEASRLAVSSMNRKAATLRSFFKYLKKEGFIERDLVRLVVLMKAPKILPRYLEVEEAETLMNQIEVVQDKALFELIYGSGLRISEALGLEWQHLDLEKKWVTVTGKGGKTRQVPLSHESVKALDSLKSSRSTAPETQEPRLNWVFLNKKGDKPLQDRMVRRILGEYLKKMNCDQKISPHGLRHSSATHLLSRGADIRSIQEYLGHQQLSTTQKYTHLDWKQLQEELLSLHPLQKKKW